MNIRITDSDSLYAQGELSKSEYEGKFNNTMIMAFYSLKDMVTFARAFAEDYIPQNGFEKYSKLHAMKSGPADDPDELMLELMGVKSENPIPDSWLVISNTDYSVFEDFLEETFILENPETQIEHVKLLISSI